MDKLTSEKTPNEKPAAEKPAAEKVKTHELSAAEKARFAERDKLLNAALSQIEKDHGKGAILKLGKAEIPAIEGISTGCLSLDLALGGVGLPRGRVVEVYGPESSGKTTLTLHVVAAAQALGGVAAFIDAEHALDPAYAKKLGVNVAELLVSQPDHGEQALDICETLVRSNAVDVIVIDSVAALVPKAEIEGEMGDSFMGLHARLMSQALRKLTGAISRSKACVIFINQIREKIGVMFGNPETTTGGRALKFYSSVRLDVRRVQTIKDGEVVIGAKTRVSVVKNKIAPPFRKVEFDILHDRGINREGDLIDLAAVLGSIQKMGTWYSYRDAVKGEIRLGQGRDRSTEFLRENPELCRAIENETRRKSATSPSFGQGATAEQPESTAAAGE
ncbi:MAG: recombinase RecA [Planctomycetes bacterium]|nr:recombinase RecA [Planctomycetota bacterium]